MTVLLNALSFWKPSRIYIGCSVGIVAYEVSKLHPSRYLGIDNHASSIDAAKRTPRGFSILSRFEIFDFRNADTPTIFYETYDMSLSDAVNHHLHTQNPDLAYSAVSRRLDIKEKSTIIGLHMEPSSISKSHRKNADFTSSASHWAYI